MRVNYSVYRFSLLRREVQLHGKSSGSGLCLGGVLRVVVEQGRCGQPAKSCEFSGASAKPNWEDPGRVHSPWQ